MTAEAVRLEARDGGLAVLWMNQPEKLNPISLEVQQGLRERLARVREDRSVRALILTGSGRAFCVGADLTTIAEGVAGETLGQRTSRMMTTLTNPLVRDLRELPVPVLAAVNGPAAGAGVGLALAADVVLMARSAYFYLPFLPKLGIVPDAGSSWFLERLAGRARATGLALLGDRLDAERAVQWGLAWACVDDAALLDEALVLARRLAALPAQAALEARNAFDAAGRNDLPAQLAYEAARQRELCDRPDFVEGVAAFREKRSPRFPGR
jgi:2-(1,2-epoxy-1,2-dihydrophenyl)acetyl-CoA isomerase